MAGKVLHEILFQVRQWVIETPVENDNIFNFGDETDFFGDTNKTF
jgi:hypothetical protein